MAAATHDRHFALGIAFAAGSLGSGHLGWAFFVFLGEMMLLHGKMYYLAPAYPMLFAAGAVELERLTEGRVWIWAKPALAAAIAAVGIVFGPAVLPILSVPCFLAWEQTLGVQQQQFERNQPSVLPQIYADMHGWEEMAERVAAFYRTLPPDVQQRTGIFANNYGDAGAIDFFGPKYGPPKAIGSHQTYWLWGPRQYTGESLIILGACLSFVRAIRSSGIPITRFPAAANGSPFTTARPAPGPANPLAAVEALELTKAAEGMAYISERLKAGLPVPSARLY